MPLPRRVCLAIFAALCITSLPRGIPALAGDASSEAFFESRIRPVLVEQCYECHAAGAQPLQAGLRLDTRDAIRRGGDSGPAVVPGNPARSLLIAALRYGEDAHQMPPDGKLPERVIEDFVAWVQAGAPDPRDAAAPAIQAASAGKDWWSLQPIESPPLPPVRRAGWAQTPLDAFVLARLESAGIQPLPDETPTALVRRLSYDLTGLPPHGPQVDDFLQRPTAANYTRLVDHWLASPHFGERWGRHWLDVVRFAETSGGGRTLLLEDAWRFRDYVIQAFNDDRPYRQFVVEQIAGDLLSPATLEARQSALVATSFLALGPTNYELQDKELLRMEVVDEQIDTIGRAFLGMTIGCARCHDHKFDPIPTRDYYALAGILRSTKTLEHANVSSFIRRPLPLDRAAAAVWQQYLDRLQRQTEQLSHLKAQQKEFQAVLTGLRQQLIESAADNGLLLIDDKLAEIHGEWTPSTVVPGYFGDGYLHDAAEQKGEKSVRFPVRVSESGIYEVRLAYTAANNRSPRVPVTVESAEASQTIYVDQRRVPDLAGTFQLLGRFHFDAAVDGAVEISTGETTGTVIADAVQIVPHGIATDKAASEATQIGAQLAQLEQQLQALEQAAQKLREQPPFLREQTLSVEEEEQTGDWHLCVRGNIRRLGPLVPRGALTAVSGPTALVVPEGRSGRLALARWIVDDAHPLTARVYVNRVWSYLIGRGLVRTPDNFGSMGNRPTHPQLLDWLATRFLAEGGSTKQLVRQIVLSRTYALSHANRAGARAAGQVGLARDPRNDLFWRLPRRRLDAEAMRDTFLWVSDQLDLSRGGPTIRPGTKTELGYQFRSRRRSVFIPVFRNTMLDGLEVFDVANPNLVVGRRSTSTRPAQALWLMNSPFLTAQVAATTAWLLDTDLSLDDTARLEILFQRTLRRSPTRAEWDVLAPLLADATKRDQAATQRAWNRVVRAVFASVDIRFLN